MTRKMGRGTQSETLRKVRQHKVGGTQSIGRAIAALRQVARADRNGVRLVDVAETLQLTTPTTLRLLKALVSEGLVSFNQLTKSYHIGSEFLSLSAIASSTATPTEPLMPALASLSEAIGDTVYLMVRQGADCVCTAVLGGRHPIRVMTFKVGEIRPLGVGSASLALLAFLTPEERDQIIHENSERFEKFGIPVHKIKVMAKEARKAGYALNPGLLIPGAYGIGLPIFRDEKLVAAVGVIAIRERLPPARRDEIAKIVTREIARLKNFRTAPKSGLD